MKVMRFIPPHAQQLEQLIDILVSAKQTVNFTNSKALANTTSPQQESVTTRLSISSGIILAHTRATALHETLVLGDNRHTIVNTYSSPLCTVDDTMDRSITMAEENWNALITKLFYTRLESWSRLKAFSKHVVGIPHGTLPNKFANKNTKALLATMKLRILSKGDVIPDCPLEVNGIKVELDLLQHELPLDYALLNNEEYLKECENKVQLLYYSKRYDSLNSWFYPKMAQLANKQKEAIIGIVQSHSSQVSMDVLRDIIMNPMFIDVFQEMMVDSADERTRDYNKLFLKAITVESFSSILACFRETSSVLVQAKVHIHPNQAYRSSCLLLLQRPCNQARDRKFWKLYS